MSSCTYPSCMMGGMGCPDEGKCDEVAAPEPVPRGISEAMNKIKEQE